MWLVGVLQENTEVPGLQLQSVSMIGKYSSLNMHDCADMVAFPFQLQCTFDLLLRVSSAATMAVTCSGKRCIGVDRPEIKV